MAIEISGNDIPAFGAMIVPMAEWAAAQTEMDNIRGLIYEDWEYQVHGYAGSLAEKLRHLLTERRELIKTVVRLKKKK